MVNSPPDAPYNLPDRLTQRWLRSLSDEDLQLAYRQADDENNSMMGFRGTAHAKDRRATRQRLNKIMDEVVRRHGDKRNQQSNRQS